METSLGSASDVPSSPTLGTGHAHGAGDRFVSTLKGKQTPLPSKKKVRVATAKVGPEATADQALKALRWPSEDATLI